MTHAERIIQEGEKAANFRPPLPSGDRALAQVEEALNQAGAAIEKLHRENSALRQDLETARRENGKLRTRLEEAGLNA
jgi:predicted RNase H-like nuclease (RuvC/YqgF family)